MVCFFFFDRKEEQSKDQSFRVQFLDLVSVLLGHVFLELEWIEVVFSLMV